MREGKILGIIFDTEKKVSVTDLNNQIAIEQNCLYHVNICL